MAILFPERLIFDNFFFEDIKLKKFEEKPNILKKLMYINDRALHHKRTHNVMSKKIFEKILKENEKLDRAVLRASFFPYDNDEIENIEDDTERVIKLAIDLLEEEPHKSIIITSERKEQDYKENSHFKGVNEIRVRSGREAEEIIKDYFEKCTSR